MVADDPGRTSGSASTQPEGPVELPARFIVVAYLLALVCVLVPLAVLGAAFAGSMLAQRGHKAAGMGAIALAIACCAFALTVLR